MDLLESSVSMQRRQEHSQHPASCDPDLPLHTCQPQKRVTSSDSVLHAPSPLSCHESNFRKHTRTHDPAYLDALEPPHPPTNETFHDYRHDYGLLTGSPCTMRCLLRHNISSSDSTSSCFWFERFHVLLLLNQLTLAYASNDSNSSRACQPA